MGDLQCAGIRPVFDRRPKLAFDNAKVSTDTDLGETHACQSGV
jgi:hypothetical protein